MSLHNFSDFCLVMFIIIVAVVGLHFGGWWAATRNLTEEQKQKLLKYSEDHPGRGVWDDDDDL